MVLPEMWNCPYSNDSFPTYAEDFSDSPSISALAAAAKAAGVVVVGGSVPERLDGKLFNTCCVFDVDGSLLGKHRYAPETSDKHGWRAVQHVLRVGC